MMRERIFAWVLGLYDKHEWVDRRALDEERWGGGYRKRGGKWKVQMGNLPSPRKHPLYRLEN